MEPIKAKPTDAGCWVDGTWGQYGTARMVMIAHGHGFGADGGDDAELVRIAAKHLDSSLDHVPSGPDLTDSEAAALFDFGGSDDAESWLNDHVAPEGYSFGWHDGEFFLQPAAWWDEDGI